MAGTRAGGLLAAQTNKAKHGSDFYVRAGHLGGIKKVPKGFACMPYEKRRAAGIKGGKISRRTKKS